MIREPGLGPEPQEKVELPALDAMERARAALTGRVRVTPVWCWEGDLKDRLLGSGTEVHLKLELFQHTGSFKVRGAFVNMLSVGEEGASRGVCAVSAGNHALAVAHAARSLGLDAKVVMPSNADRSRVDGCRALGADVIEARDVHTAFEEARRLEREEGRFFVHPFEGRETVLGTASVGLEMAEQIRELDAAIVPIGGGGLCAGIAAALARCAPRCDVFGVEPDGADTMHRSFASGAPEAIDAVRTIADSLGAPHAAPYTYALCRQLLSGLASVNDDALRSTMRLAFDELKIALEPAGAAALAALLGPLRERLAGKRVGIVVCGSNVHAERFWELVRDAPSYR